MNQFKYFLHIKKSIWLENLVFEWLEKRKKISNTIEEIPADKWCKHFDDDSIKFALFWINFNTIHFNWNISIHLLSMFPFLCLCLFFLFVSSSLSFINLSSLSLSLSLCWQCEIDFWLLFFCIENGTHTACACFSSKLKATPVQIILKRKARVVCGSVSPSRQYGYKYLNNTDYLRVSEWIWVSI